MCLSLQHCGLLYFQIWCEQTDPQKFVYEDINIAAYLLVRPFNCLQENLLMCT